MLSTAIQKVYAHDGLCVYLVLYCADYIFFNGNLTLGDNLCVTTLLTKPNVSTQSIWRIAQLSGKSLYMHAEVQIKTTLATSLVLTEYPGSLVLYF